MIASMIIAGAVATFLLVVAPIWIGAHYLTRWRMAKSLSPADEERLADLWGIAERLETRLAVIESILDEEEDGESRYGDMPKPTQTNHSQRKH